MAKASYGQYCALAYALDVLGESWTLLVVRELLHGPRTYPSLLNDLPNMGAVLLTKRLADLERFQVVDRLIDEPRSADEPYVLTERGRLLEPLLQVLAGWGLDFLALPSEDEVYSPLWSLLELKARFKPERAGDLDLIFEIQVDDEIVHLEIRDRQLFTHLGPAVNPRFTLKTDPASFILMLRGVLTVREGIAEKCLVIEGSLIALWHVLEALDLRVAHSRERVIHQPPSDRPGIGSPGDPDFPGGNTLHTGRGATQN